ncbi:MAG: gas vesicle protein GvpG [Acidobacteria bacterium]|nr:gas vesicle protein GvpG [Acidobacteriota bacterium]
MFLIDDLLALPFKAPIGGVKWVMRQIQTMADRELMDDTIWKQKLLELQMQLELGDISEEDYAAEEAVIFQHLREIRVRQQEMADEILRDMESAETEISIHSDYGE